MLSKRGETTPSTDDMNPFDYWFKTKPELQGFFDQYYRQRRPILDLRPTIATYVDELYINGTAMEKLMAVNVLAVVNLYFL